jgi:hypothetical protein
MSNIYVEYVASTSGAYNLLRVFAKVPRAKINA